MEELVKIMCAKDFVLHTQIERGGGLIFHSCVLLSSGNPLPREPKPKPRVVGIYHVNGRPVQAPLVSLSRERGVRYAYWLSAAVCFATQFSFTIS